MKKLFSKIKFDKIINILKNINFNKKVKLNTKRDVVLSRRKASRIASIVLFSVVSLSLLFNLIFYTKLQTIRNSAVSAEEQIQEELKNLKDNDAIAAHSAVIFTDSFLRNYLNVPTDKEKRIKRLERLDQYFVAGFDTSKLETINEFNGNRKLKSLKYVDTIRVDKDKAKIYFTANFDITNNPVDKEDKKEPKTVNFTNEIVVPVITDGDGYAVYDYPNLTSRNLKADIVLEEKTIDGEEVSTSDRELLMEFLQEFFIAYGKNDEKLPYMSQIEQGLKGLLFENVSIRKAAYNNDKFHLIVDVVYQNSETSFSSLYTYELQLEKDKNNFFITNID